MWLLGICFLRVALEGAVEGIGDGEKGGWFHVVKALNESVDEVRKEVWRAASGAERKGLKGLRFIILKNKKNRTRREHKVMGELARTQRQVARACELKDELSHFWTYSNPSNAEKFLKAWKKRVKLSRIGPLRKFAEQAYRAVLERAELPGWRHENTGTLCNTRNRVGNGSAGTST
jgi:hypothetical protein